MAGENLVEIPPANASGASHIYINASCGGSNGTSCPATGGGYSAAINLYGADITLADDTPPTVSSVGGDLTSSSTLSGSGDISFSATDTGSGLYQAVFSIDGRVLSRELLDGDGSSCRNVGATSDGSNAFFAAEPCPLALSDDLSFDTSQVADGSHLLTVVLLDAAGNTTTILNRHVSIDNHPVTSPPVTSPPITSPPITTPPITTAPGNPIGVGGTPVTAGGGAGGSSSGGATSISAVASLVTSLAGASIGPGSSLALRGPANGTNASDQATLTAHWVSTARELRTSGYGAVDRISGRLSTIANVGIGGAGIDVYETPAYHGAVTRRIGSVVSGPTGQWTLTLPRGVSSTALRFTYFSYLDDTVAAATATLRLSVRAGIALRIAPHIASVGRRIFFSGAVHGSPIPQGGKQLVLEARSGREAWVPFETIRTNSKGGYRASYRFKLAGNIVYQFKVLSRYEADFPFLNGTSNVVDVHEH